MVFEALKKHNISWLDTYGSLDNKAQSKEIFFWHSGRREEEERDPPIGGSRGLSLNLLSCRQADSAFKKTASIHKHFRPAGSYISIL